MSSTLQRRVLQAGAVTIAGGALFAAIGSANSDSSSGLSDVPTANQRAAGYAPATRLSAELAQIAVAQGSTKLENPDGIVSFYGYENDVPTADNPLLPQMLPTPANPTTEAIKTEPDKNTYLAFKHAAGADPAYDYGSHFLFQGHENAAENAAGTSLGLLTRINLDADAAHRVTLMATEDTAGAPLTTIDGSTWEPFSQRLLLTTEGPAKPTYAATATFPSTVEDVSGALGRGGYEGIQDDGDGNVWIVEDIGGAGKGGTKAKLPNSFVYRYVPRRRGDLHNGKLQALQVSDTAGQPITVDSQTALSAPDQVLLHSYGHNLDTRWVTVHDTAIDGSTPFNANAAAKAVDATPFKRPENGVFRPGTKFGEFEFTETGDTNATSPENGGGAGGWGTVQKLVQRSPSADTGTLTVLYASVAATSGFDNIQFLSRDDLGVVQDAGDTLHGQLETLDSGFVIDARTDYSNPSNQPTRWLAEARDPSATIDAANGGFGKNDGDNEITGLHISDGDPGVGGILGAKTPTLFKGGWRWFYTQQHGDNPTYEIVPAARGDHGADG